MAKKKDRTDLAIRLLKSEGSEQRFCLGLAYPADRPDQAVAADGYRDFVKAENLERAAWSFMVKSRNIGVGHQVGTGGAAQVVESHIHRAGPWQVTGADGSTFTVQNGDWLVGVVFTPEAWQAVKAGRLNGFSPQGSARRSKPSKADLRKLRKEK